MFRSNNYCSRYEETPIQVDTPILIPGDNARQNKNGYQFTVNDRSSHFDWFNGFFEVKFSIKQIDSNDGDTANGADAAAIAASTASMINGSTSLINNLTIKQNGKVVYEGNTLFLTTYVKSLIEYSEDYSRSIGSNEFFYLDNKDKIEEHNYCYKERLELTK